MGRWIVNAADPQVLQVEDGMYTAFSERQYYVVMKAGESRDL